MSSKYIFLDIDGTLVSYDGTMAESAREALIAAQKNGHRLIICTGRLRGQVYPWLLDAVDFDGIITSSGASVIYRGERVFSQYFSRAQLRYLEEKYGEVGAIPCYHTEEKLVMTKEMLERALRMFDRFGLPRDQVNSLFGDVRCANAWELDCIEKSVYLDAGHTLDEMRKLLGGEYTIDGYSFGDLPQTNGEVVLSGISKARGIDELCRHLHVPICDTIAVGDGSNDMAMLEFAGTGVAMGNAKPELKAVASMVTDDIDKDGIRNAFYKLGLIG